MSELHTESSELETTFDEVWAKRGTNFKTAEAVQLLGNRWTSGYGLPLFIALKESNINTDLYPNNNTVMGYSFGIFEDRSLGNNKLQFEPIGFIFFREVKDLKNLSAPTRIVCDDDFQMGITANIIKQNGDIGSDPLFSKLNEKIHSTISWRKYPLAAIRVGFDSTYGEQRNRTISKLQRSELKNKGVLNEMLNSNIRSGTGRLSENQHAHLGIGKLLLSASIDICRRLSKNDFYIVAPNENSRNLIAQSGYKYSECIVNNNKALEIRV